MMPVKKSLGLLVAAAIFGWHAPVDAQIVPGTGQQLTELADDFEDENWSFTLNLPKASTNIDKIDRQPAGFSGNGLWFESTYRGTPDFVKRVPAPEGALPGSTGALALQTLYSGIPGQLSNKFQQDDLIANVSQKLGFMMPAAWTPSYVVRVYLPPFEQWEQRVGSTFGFRADCQTIINKPTKVGRFFRTGGTSREIEQYWPGFFIQFNGKNHPQHAGKNSATILIRSGERGEDIPGPLITEPGWWTLGMTITPDGRVHYYGHAGVANLTSKDHLYSNFPYGYKCLQTSTYFFNVVNQDDGRTWSTRWIVDDPKVYVATRPYTPPSQTAQVPTRPISQTTTAPAAKPAPAAPATPAAPAVPAESVTPAAPTTQSAPAAQATPVQATPVPALQATPAAPATQVNPAAPAAAPADPAATLQVPAVPQLQTAPAAPTTPPLQGIPAPVTTPAGKPAKRASTLASLPALSSTPTPVTPVKARTLPAAAPALLPDETSSDSSPAAAPVIQSPGPAPIELPGDDAPVLPAPPAALLVPDAPQPPAPATPE